MNRDILILAILLAGLGLTAEAGTERSQSAKTEFKQRHPCPATGVSKGACERYVIDYVKLPHASK